MKTKILLVTIISAICAFSLFILSCGGVSSNTSENSNVSSANSQVCQNTPCGSEHEISTKQDKEPCLNPIVIGVALDQTGSMRWSGITALTIDEFKPLIARLSDCGGEIGITFVRADSAKQIERLRFTELPVIPNKRDKTPNEEDYEYADYEDAYNLELNDWREKVQKQKSVQQPEIDKYFEVLKPLLAAPPNGNTDFWTSVNRLDVFLNEGNASWNVKPHRYLVIYSDGEDNIGKEKHSFKSDAHVIWVNANASGKSMKDFPYQRVESFQSAIREILAKEGVK